jgi:hypothetical protein
MAGRTKPTSRRKDWAWQQVTTTPNPFTIHYFAIHPQALTLPFSFSA